jgi:hypothetical protein
MVEEVLTAHPRAAVRVRIVAPAKYARVGQVGGEEVAQPVDAVAGGPRFLAVPVQAMDSDDTVVLLAVERATKQQGSILDGRVGAFSYHLQTKRNCSNCLCLC